MVRKMTFATCPYCGKVNRGGLLEEVRPGEPPPLLDLCEHHVFEVFTQLPWDYLNQELHKDLNELPMVTQYGPQIEAIVSTHLRIIEHMGFASAEHDRDVARQEVVEFLQARGYKV
jgi:hypothetical protein